jgi:hypothetical protein
MQFVLAGTLTLAVSGSSATGKSTITITKQPSAFALQLNN